jgi:hypothetical protein
MTLIVSYTPICVSRIQYVIRISLVTIIIPDCLHVFFIYIVKYSARLPCVFHWAIHTFHLVYATFLHITEEKHRKYQSFLKKNKQK